MTNLPTTRNHRASTRARSGRRPADWMVRQLPAQMVDEGQHDFFVRFVQLFQSFGDELFEHADNIESLVDLSVTPETHIDWLGSWIGLEGLDPDVPELFRRKVTASAAMTLATRSTMTGLHRYLELLAGGPARVEDGGGVFIINDPDTDPATVLPSDTTWVAMWVEDTGAIIRGDEDATTVPVLRRGQLRLGAFIALVRAEIPAHVRAELYLGEELVWSTEKDERW